MTILQIRIKISQLPWDNLFFAATYSNTHEYIVMFWDVLKEFSDDQKRKFLQFVTSCMSPPYSGFSVSMLSPSCHFSFDENVQAQNFLRSVCSNFEALQEPPRQFLRYSKVLWKDLASFFFMEMLHEGLGWRSWEHVLTYVNKSNVKSGAWNY